jgi:hypothetical protein
MACPISSGWLYPNIRSEPSFIEGLPTGLISTDDRGDYKPQHAKFVLGLSLTSTGSSSFEDVHRHRPDLPHERLARFRHLNQLCNCQTIG